MQESIKTAKKDLENIVTQWQKALNNKRYKILGNLPEAPVDPESVLFETIYFNFETLSTIQKDFHEQHAQCLQEGDALIQKIQENFQGTDEEKENLKKELTAAWQEFQKTLEVEIERFSETRNGKILAFAEIVHGALPYSWAEALKNFRPTFNELNAKLSDLERKINHVELRGDNIEDYLAQLENNKQALNELKEKIELLYRPFTTSLVEKPQQTGDTFSSLEKQVRPDFKKLSKSIKPLQERLERDEEQAKIKLAKKEFNNRNDQSHENFGKIKTLQEAIGSLFKNSSDESFETVTQDLEHLKKAFQDTQAGEIDRNPGLEEYIKSFFERTFEEISGLERNLTRKKSEREEFKAEEKQRREEEERREIEERVPEEESLNEEVPQENREQPAEDPEIRSETEETISEEEVVSNPEDETDREAIEAEEDQLPQLRALKTLLRNKLQYAESVIENNSNEQETAHYITQRGTLLTVIAELENLDNPLMDRLTSAKEHMSTSKSHFTISPAGDNFFETVINFITAVIKKIQEGTLLSEVGFWGKYKEKYRALTTASQEDDEHTQQITQSSGNSL